LAGFTDWSGGYSGAADNYLSDIPLSIRGRIEAFLKSASFLRWSPVVTHLWPSFLAKNRVVSHY
jgi:hypothetical protein